MRVIKYVWNLFFQSKEALWEQCVYDTARSKGLIVEKMNNNRGWLVIDPTGKRKTLEVYPK